LLWSKIEGTQAAVLWHTWQSVGNPLVTWFGVVVCWNFVRWHETHVVLSPTNTPLEWQLLQVSVAWKPVSGNNVLEWSNVALSHVAVLWQTEQSVGNPAATWLGLVVA
jgi:hypothetical protein